MAGPDKGESKTAGEGPATEERGGTGLCCPLSL